MMTKKYGRLTFNERIEIEKLLSHRKSYADIGKALARSKSTIQRDVKRQGRDSYKAMNAEWSAVGKSSNRRSGKNKIKVCEALEKYVLEKLQLRWSPRQISVSLQRKFPENKAMQISHEAIYLYIYLHSKKELKNLLISELRQKRKYRGNVRRGKDKRTTIKDPVRIDERPLLRVITKTCGWALCSLLILLTLQLQVITPATAFASRNTCKGAKL